MFMVKHRFQLNVSCNNLNCKVFLFHIVCYDSDLVKTWIEEEQTLLVTRESTLTNGSDQRSWNIVALTFCYLG